MAELPRPAFQSRSRGRPPSEQVPRCGSSSLCPPDPASGRALEIDRVNQECESFLLQSRLLSTFARAWCPGDALPPASPPVRFGTTRWSRPAVSRGVRKMPHRAMLGRRDAGAATSRLCFIMGMGVSSSPTIRHRRTCTPFADVAARHQRLYTVDRTDAGSTARLLDQSHGSAGLCSIVEAELYFGARNASRREPATR